MNGEGGETGQVQRDEEDDVAENIDSDSAAQVPVPVDVHTQVPLDEEGAVQVLVQVDVSGGTAPVLIDGGGHVQDLVAEEDDVNT